MASASQLERRQDDGNKSLLTDVLKGRMGFDGFVVGDWNGHGQVAGCTSTDCPQAINAGLDMFMAPAPTGKNSTRTRSPQARSARCRWRGSTMPCGASCA
jgi:beta-glucosidase-like glycosyl hydrolase